MVASIFDKFPKPPCAELLGWNLIDLAPDRGWIRIGFIARPVFCNPAGFVQGGLLAAMLDDTMGPAVLVKTNGALFTSTIDLRVSFLSPARVGPLIGEASVVQIGRTIAFVEGKLTQDGVLVATASTSARVVETSKIPHHARSEAPAS